MFVPLISFTYYFHFQAQAEGPVFNFQGLDYFSLVSLADYEDGK